MLKECASSVKEQREPRLWSQAGLDLSGALGGPSGLCESPFPHVDNDNCSPYSQVLDFSGIRAPRALSHVPGLLETQ